MTIKCKSYNKDKQNLIKNKNRKTKIKNIRNKS